MKGTQEGQSPYLSGDVPVECVGFMPISSTVARVPSLSIQELNGNRHKLKHTGRNHPRKASSPSHRPKLIYTSSARCVHVKRPTRQSTSTSVAAHQREVDPGERNSLLTNSGNGYKRQDAQFDMMVSATSAVIFTQTSAGT